MQSNTANKLEKQKASAWRGRKSKIEYSIQRRGDKNARRTNELYARNITYKLDVRST